METKAAREVGLAARVSGLQLWQPLKVRNFRRFWVGQSVALLGNEFYAIALAWYVLQLTGSGLAFGTILMVSAIPRAALMLFGGAITDRFSQKGILFLSDAGRAILVGALAALILFDAAQLWHLYVASFLFGVITAFFYPAFFAIVPALLSRELLKAGNSLVQSTAQLGLLAGPALAGLVVAAAGAGAAFTVYAAALAFSAVMILLVEQPAHTGDDSLDPSGMLTSIHRGLAYAWKRPALRTLLAIIAAINLSVQGAVAVGLPWLADQRFGTGAIGIGVLFSMWGGGALLGSLVAGLTNRSGSLGLLMLGLMGLLGTGIALLGIVPNAPAAAATTLVMGVGVGFINVVALAWLQEKTGSDMRGRVMSLVMLANFGVAPLSLALAGALVDLQATAMFVSFGTFLLLATALAARNREVRAIQ